MPAAVIRRADADRIAENLRAHGRPVPDALKPPAPTGPAPTRPPARAATPKPPAPHSIPAQRGHEAGPAGARGAAGHTTRSAGRPTGRSGGRGGRRRGGILPGSGGSGDGGGVLLAIIAYPLALSVIRYGANGPGMWLRSKFLNQSTTLDPSGGKVGRKLGGIWNHVGPPRPAATPAPAGPGRQVKGA